MQASVAFASLALLAFQPLLSNAVSLPRTPAIKSYPYQKQGECENGPNSRQCWSGNYSIDTNYYESHPITNVTREYWFTVENITMAPDGYEIPVLVVNRSIPGPLIEANWGDEIVVHVTNLIPNNGTAIHWHGIRQYNNNELDGVPGVTQCPIAPNETYTYRFIAEQYGSSWWHSHFSLQYSEGLHGPMVIHGPATANYDVDMGPVVMTDWTHDSVFTLWYTSRLPSGPPSLSNALINGNNVFDCNPANDTKCIGNGTRSEWNFESGKKYLFRLINTSLYANIRFGIDGHNLTVISNDFVPLVPYQTDNVLMATGQRYDVIVEANAKPGNYWLRMQFQEKCCPNDYANNTLGIIRYDANSTELPTTPNKLLALPDTCADEPASNLVPWVNLNVDDPAEVVVLDLGDDPTLPQPKGFLWTLNTTYLWVNWSAPTNMLLADNITTFPQDYFVTPQPEVLEHASSNEWVYYVFNDISTRNRSHPMHLHGHDFYLLGIGEGNWTGDMSTLNRHNPPRRDTATWPESGWQVIGFKTDNPGTWLLHCHIAWHSSQGLGVQFVEQYDKLLENHQNPSVMALQNETCASWNYYWDDDTHDIQEDAGI